MGGKAGSTAAKTQPTSVNPQTFIEALGDENRQRDAARLLGLMKKVTGERPVMWGPSIVGFGAYHYTYASGRQGDWPRAGFSPRKSGLTIYCVPGFSKLGELLAKLGPHKTSVSCLNIKRLDDVDLEVLATIVKKSYDGTRSTSL